MGEGAGHAQLQEKSTGLTSELKRKQISLEWLQRTEPETTGKKSQKRDFGSVKGTSLSVTPKYRVLLFGSQGKAG